MTEQQLTQFSERLLDQQVELLGVADLIDESSNTVLLDQSSMSGLPRIDAMQQSTGQDHQNELLQRIKAALIRIDEDHYGKCIGCLLPIPLMRLQVDPAIEYCVNCAA